MKTPFNKILVPTDFSDTSMQAIRHAAYLASKTNAEMILMHVLPVRQVFYEMPEPVVMFDDEEESLKIADRKLEEITQELHRKYKIHPRELKLRGRISHEIMETVKKEKVDLIIMGTHGAKGFEEFFIGSNAQKVVGNAPCPVLTIQQHSDETGFDNIVLPIDRSPHSREKVDLAVQIAKIYGSTLHIIGLTDDDDPDEYNKLQIIVDQVVHFVKNSGVNYTRHAVRGDNPAEEAMKYGNTVNADLIIIMTDHESKLSGILPGASSKHIVNNSKIPVLSVQPHYRNTESWGLDGQSLIY
ncbi:MAG TPA: universal stress protein [Bacteroidia bacterium]|jgi:nucleotide-binding universal stress UspA family protein|nr:universal stress protein [Bacteroidia bacterium]